jgi:hypothetical protein
MLRLELYFFWIRQQIRGLRLSRQASILAIISRWLASVLTWWISIRETRVPGKT